MPGSRRSSTTAPRPGALAALRAPGVAPMLTSGLIGRLPQGMMPLALLLVMRHAGLPYGSAGFIAACGTLAYALTTPVYGRLIDRFGQTRVLPALAIAYPIALVIAMEQALAGAPVWQIAAFAMLAGGTVPALPACIRVTWPTLLPSPELRRRALSLEAALQELLYVVSPLVVYGLASALTPVWSVLATAAAGGLGTLAFAATRASRNWRPERDHDAPTGRRHPLRFAGVRRLALTHAGLGWTYGSLQVVITALAVAAGSTASAGVALAVYAVGSVVGGLLAAHLRSSEPSPRALAAFFALAALLLSPMLIEPSMLFITVLLGFAGLPLAPGNGLIYALLREVAPAEALTESYGWVMTALLCGSASGAASCGLIVQHLGTRAGVVSAVSGALTGSLIALSGTRTLRPARRA